MITAVTDPESNEAVARMPGGVGASALCSLLVVRPALNALTLNGVPAGVKTLADGTYPLAKDIRFVTKGAPSLAIAVTTATRVVRKPDGGSQEIRAVFVYWFVADNQLTNDHLDRMWRMAWHLVSTGTLQRWAYVSCLGLCLPCQEEAVYQRVQAFLTAAVPEFQLALPVASPPP